MQSTKTILSVGLDITLLESRKQIFKSLGYKVISTTRGSTALDIVQRRWIDVAVLCHTIEYPQQQDLAEQLKSASPKTSVLLLQGGVFGSTEFTSTEPAELVLALKTVISLPAAIIEAAPPRAGDRLKRRGPQ